VSVTGDVYVRSTTLMGTIVTIEVVGHSATEAERSDREAAIERALEWFRETESCCSRFNAESEICRLAASVGTPVRASSMLLGAVRFALALAEETIGAFDPTVGHLMEARGDNVEYQTGAIMRTMPPVPFATTWRDVRVDTGANTIMLLQPLMLDLGAVAKGLAVDLAARELRPFENFVIDAGGDLYFGGTNAMQVPWSVGIRHPRDPDALIQTLRASNVSVCTSGDYERRFALGAEGEDHHILDPRTRQTATASISATVLAPSAMVADALGTAAFVLGGSDGVALLERHGVDGLIVSPSMERYETRGMHHYFGDAAS
jgi:thiamine biosynthesis lipoprotein